MTMKMDDYFRAQQDLYKTIEKASGVNQLGMLDHNLSKVIMSFREPYLLDTAFGGALRDVIQQRDLAKEALAAVAPTGALHFLETLERQRSLYEENFEIVQASHAASLQLFDRLRFDSRDLLSGLLGESESAITRILQNDISRIHDFALGITSPSASAALATALGGLTSVLQASGEDALSGLFTNPLAESARHFRESSAMLAARPDPLVSRAIERSLLLVDAELRTGNDAFLRIEPSFDLDDTPPPARRLFVPRIQRIELKRLGDAVNEDTDLDDVLAALPIGQTVLVAREVVDLFLDFVDAQDSTTSSIFKMTARVGRVCAELPFAVPLDRRSFAEFIDDLYWLLYESPGANSLRYLTEHGGPFTRAECDIVFVIKRLRNHYRHDPEHGSDRDIEKKFEAVRADLRARGAEQLRSRADFRALHRILLEEVAVFLRKLHDAT